MKYNVIRTSPPETAENILQSRPVPVAVSIREGSR